MQFLNRKPSPAMIISVVALCFAMVGGAYAAGPLSKSQVKKIAKKVAKKEINKAAPGLSVAKAANADNATNATNAQTAQNANSVDGASILVLNHRSGNVTDAVIGTIGEVTFRVDCASGNETIEMTTTANDNDVSAISNDASATDGSASQIDGDFQDSFDVGDVFVAGPGAGAASDRIYNIVYAAASGKNVTATLSTEDAVAGNNCVVSGTAISGYPPTAVSSDTRFETGRLRPPRFRSLTPVDQPHDRPGPWSHRSGRDLQPAPGAVV